MYTKQKKITEHTLTTSKTPQRQVANKSDLVCHSIRLRLCAVFEVVHLIIRKKSKLTKELDAHNYLTSGIACTHVHLKTLEAAQVETGCTVVFVSSIMHTG